MVLQRLRAGDVARDVTPPTRRLHVTPPCLATCAQEDYGGALCKFTQELEDKKAYDKPLDGFELFCSAQQVAQRARGR